MTVDRSTERWRGITVLGFFGIGVGAFFKSPGLLLASMVAIGYAAYARGGSPPAIEVELDRTVADADPAPGERVRVETTVRNVGDDSLADLRVVDGVPSALDVVAGASRTYTALRPGETATFEYVVEARRGDHVWAPATVLGRDVSGAVEREVPVAGPPTRLSCIPRLETAGKVPLRSVTSPYAGTVTSATAGPGVEFHSTREYRPGDSLSRVDWNRFAQTGELATVEFNAERMATVLVVVDVRRRAYAETATDAAHAVEYCLDAANGLVGSLLDAGNQVGIAGLGPSVTYLEPGLGRTHRARAREFLATALPGAPPDEQTYPRHLDELRRRLAGDVQVLWVSPMVDEYAVSIPRTLVTDGHAVTTVSPDVTVAGSPGEQLASAERKLRLSQLREANVRVVDWQPETPLEAAVSTAERGWT